MFHLLKGLVRKSSYCYFLDQETDILCQFLDKEIMSASVLDPESDIMGERNFMSVSIMFKALVKGV